MRIDIHCHIVQRFRPFQPDGRFSFEPLEGCAPADAYLSPRLTGGLAVPLLKWWLGLPRHIPDNEFDPTLERFFLDQILGAEQVDRVVVLAMDQFHTAAGEPLGPRRRGRERGTDLYVSNTYVHNLWRRYPQRILFGASIHPYREFQGMTAVAMLDALAASGAVLIKWLPLAQNIDPRDPRTIRFLRRAAQLGMPMLIHYGGEKILANHHPELEDPAPLLQTLRELRQEGAMPTVIVAHVATPMPFESSRGFETLTAALLGEFADAPLYADISALGLPHRAKWFRKIATMPDLHPKLVYGSDFPLPPMPSAFRWRLGRHYAEVQTARYWLDRDVLLKSRLGMEEGVFERGSVLLKHRIDAADAMAGLLVERNE
jgi:predicted TIM-barrel fold metal-dependent hydrolase